LSAGDFDFASQTPSVFATYVHQLDPIIFQLGEKIALRWYGLAYLAGFIAAYYLLRHLSAKKLWVLAPDKIADFIAGAAMFGVFLGGRLGYIAFYHIPREGWAEIARDPLLIIRVWEGGMASHGGILGLVAFTLFYAWKHKISWAAIADGLCIVGPIGVFFGRIANFINGELYGRIANGVPWAVKFPDALQNPKLPESALFREALHAASEADPNFSEAIAILPNAAMGDQNYAFYFQKLTEWNRESEKVSAAIEPYLSPRHPSQLYEGLLEGALLFLILWGVRLKFPKAPGGLLTGLFFGLYASFRIFAERFREPDAAWVIEGILTQGQFLSLFMYLFAAAFLGLAYKNWQQAKA
jgi:phosphatidylglycerol:prolipoprotein diacylglycerol transferase